VTDQDYGALPGITASAIKAGRLSMAHMRHEMLRPRDDSDATPALRWGKLAHAALLEPVRFASMIAVWTGGRRAGPAWTAFEAANVGKVDVTPVELERLTAMQVSSRADKDSRFALSQVSETERVIQWTDPTLGPCKCRLDGWCERVILEYKTTRTVDKRRFLNQAESLGYHLQLGWYWHAAGRPENVWLVTQESAAPYCVVTYSVAASVLETAYQEALDIAARYRVCEVCNSYPGPHPGVQNFERPAWTMPDMDNEEEG
jgi:hypothetical protein